MIIYTATNVINGKIYIGKFQGKLQRRIGYHLKSVSSGSKLYLHSAIRKYGIKCFIWKIENAISDKIKLCDLEKQYILFYKKLGYRLYNMTNGGDGNSGLSRKGIPNSKETRTKISIANKGKAPWNKGVKGFTHTEETKQSISNKLKGRSPWNKGLKLRRL